ncbi:hypothetical protein AcV7_001998 [Taiwanofungus camphoratus]|nr:hypothetical protein AcV7_001998 [Antrodia cinnamomea]
MPTSTTVGHWSSVLVLVFFVLSNIAVVLPSHLPIPRVLCRRAANTLVALRVISPDLEPVKKSLVPLNFITVPFFSVLILLITGAIDGTVVRGGIVGSNGVRPLDIMALFISLAYLAISSDATGLLRFLAFWVVRTGGSSGRRLFTYLYVFFLACGVVVGNDPVILSGTAFLAYLTRVSGISCPTAWIFSQFAAANMASVVLISSNPTNLVLSGAFSLSFVTYTAHCFIPFLFAAIFVYPVLVLGLFRSRDMIPRSISLGVADGEDFGTTMVDKRGAIFGSVLLLVTLGTLVGTSVVGVPVWEVTVPPAIIMFMRDLHHDWTRHAPDRSRFPQEAISRQTGGTSAEDQMELQILPSGPQSSQAISTKPPTTLLYIAEHCLGVVSSTFPTVLAVVRRLPFALVPFAFLMFILVQGLSSKGWIELFARWWKSWTDRTGVLGAVGGMGFLACIFCNVCGTNIGATILLARMIQLWISYHGGSEPLNPRTREGAIYALALGSNYGAFTLTFSASLAGLLWRRILHQKGIHVRPMQFLRLNLPIAFTAMSVSSAVLVAQIYIVYRHN